MMTKSACNDCSDSDCCMACVLLMSIQSAMSATGQCHDALKPGDCRSAWEMRSSVLQHRVPQWFGTSSINIRLLVGSPCPRAVRFHCEISLKLVL